MSTSNIAKVEDYLIALLDVARNKNVEIYDDQIHRIFFILENEKKINLGLNFMLDYYGPFSPDLDGILVNLIEKEVVKVNFKKPNYMSFEYLVLGRIRSYELNGNYSVNVSSDIKRFFEEQISKNTKEILEDFSKKYKQYMKILEVIGKLSKKKNTKLSKIISKIIGEYDDPSKMLEIEENTISSYIRDAIVDLEIAEQIKSNKDKEKENRMLFCLASSAEKFTKALLPLFILGIKETISLFVRLEDILNDSCKSSSLDDIIGKANLIMLMAFNVNTLKKIGHEPISSLELGKLLESIKELLPNNLVSLRVVFGEIIQYMRKNPNERRYDDMEKIIDKINSVLDPSNLKGYVVDMIVKVYENKNPNLLDDAINAYTYALKNVSKEILYMLYLEHAAGSITRYSVGREDADEEYLEDLRGHKGQIFEFLEKEKELAEKLLMSSQLNH